MITPLDVLAVGAHPDDIELMCAGTLLKLGDAGYRTGTLSLTAGEMGTRGTPEERRREFEAASAILGVESATILDLPDGQIRSDHNAQLKVITELRRTRPRLVLAPYWETRHPDHANCSQLVRESVFLSGLKKVDTSQDHYRPERIAYYMELYPFPPSFIVDVSDTFDRRMQAILAYQSQLHNPERAKTDEEETFISSPEFLESIKIRASYWGSRIGVKYGEPFLVREPLAVQDPLALVLA